MIPAGHNFNLLSPQEVSLIHQSALRILEEMGVEIQNQELLQLMADMGWTVDFSAERVRFPSTRVERFIADAPKYDWETTRPQVSSAAGVYHSLFHDPENGQLIAWNEENLAYYFTLARSLPNITSADMLGSRLPAPGPLEPLYERYYCWKYGAEPGGSIYIDEICPYLFDLYHAYADEKNQLLSEVFHATVYMAPALKLGRHEAHQVIWFHKHDLHVNIGGSMMTLGANAPVTMAGGVALNLAEQFTLRFLEQALTGVSRLSLGSSLSALDMRTTIRPFGRPEMTITGLMTAQMARFYGASFSGHGGLTDAKLPSVESGAQKALSALALLLAGGSIWLDAGLLAIDEVVSPIQLVLDNELLSSLIHFTKEFAVTPDSIGLEAILEAGPGGQYLDSMHTARYFRGELWFPSIWSRQMLRPWIESGSQLDIDQARQIALEVKKRGKPSSLISPQLEHQILSIISQARHDLID